MNKIKNINKITKLFIVLTVMMSVILLISIFYNFKQNFYIKDINKDYKQIRDDYYALKKSYEEEQNLNDNLKDKVNFFDEHISFVVEEFNNKYVSYNCMKYLTQGKNYKFLAYNTEQAISEGYEQYKCPIRVELGLE